MKHFFTFALLCFALCCAAFDIDVNSYGAGPLLKPGRTFHVSTSGKDTNDGKTPQTAFRTIKRGAARLRAGDTLLVAGGVYEESGISLNLAQNIPNYQTQCGKPGAPIRLMGAPGAKVVIQGGTFLPCKGSERVVTFKNVKAPVYNTVWEAPSQIELQMVDFPEIVKEIPGTF